MTDPLINFPIGKYQAKLYMDGEIFIENTEDITNPSQMGITLDEIEEALDEIYARKIAGGS